MSQVLLHCMLVLPFELWSTSPCLPEYSLCVSAVHVGWPAALKEDDPLQNTCDMRAYIQHHLADFWYASTPPILSLPAVHLQLSRQHGLHPLHNAIANGPMQRVSGNPATHHQSQL